MSISGINISAQTIDLLKARITIEKIVASFSLDYLKGDSVALAAYYTKDAMLGTAKGDEILSVWGRSIRNSIKTNTRNLIFTITTLTGDDEFLIDYGYYEGKDDKNQVKYKGKYVVVWKQENGEWKIHRDNGL
jgi:ketosteroid isomerase-like protein